MRKAIIAGNWKMNKCSEEAVELASKIKEELAGISDVEIVIAPVSTCLKEVSKVIKGSNIALGGQNIHWEASGAFTGEISAEMLKDAGCSYVIIGHSERRTYFGETNRTVNKKISAALKAGLKPILCVGETLDEREKSRTFEVVSSQMIDGLMGFDAATVRDIVIAYEPVWAIGTGKTATAEQANEVHTFIRTSISEIYSEGTAEGLRIQYGGSANPGNAAQLMSQENIDGLLVGGASLKWESFSQMVKDSRKQNTPSCA